MADNSFDSASNPSESGDLRANLRDAGQAIVAAGSSLGAMISKHAGKYTEDLPEKLKSATISARERLDQADSEGEIRAAASNFVAEAEKQFKAFQQRDLEFSDDVKGSLQKAVEDARGLFNEKIGELRGGGAGPPPGQGADSVLDDVRERLESLFARVQEQFGGANQRPDIIDGEIVADEDK